MSLNFQVVLDPNVSGVVPDAVSFETGATPEQVGPLVYEHHGEGFDHAPGALTRFYEDLISGHPMPLTLAMRWVGGVDAVVATALFLQRDLAIQPATLELVAATDLTHRLGPNFSGHVDPDLAGFFRVLGKYFPKELSKEDVGVRLMTAVQWVREYLLEQRLPNLGAPPPSPRVLDVGTTGFVLASCDAVPQVESWFELFRQGFLRGLLIGPETNEGLRQAIATKKSSAIDFDLKRASEVLNDLEGILGGPRGWHLEEGFLHAPKEGTAILVSHLVEVFLRV